MRRAFDLVQRLVRVCLVAAFLTLIAAVTLQVVSRLTLPRPPIWTEELSRFCLLYLAAFGAGLALKSGDLVNVDLLTVALPARVRRALEAVVLLGIVAFCLTLLPGAYEFVDIGWFQTSPALGWQMVWVHLSVLIVPVTLALAAAEKLLAILVEPAR